MIPTKGVVRVLALATNEGKKRDMCTGMSCCGKQRGGAGFEKYGRYDSAPAKLDDVPPHQPGHVVGDEGRRRLWSRPLDTAVDCGTRDGCGVASAGQNGLQHEKLEDASMDIYFVRPRTHSCAF